MSKTTFSNIAFLAFFAGLLAAWGTHLGWGIIKLASDQGATIGQIALATIGTIIPPIGMVHGIMIWLGVGV